MSLCIPSPTVSVIIPVYNTEKTLNLAVQSILFQTFQRWELLLVDDGSTDCSGQLCDQYASRDSRIRVIHTENNGCSSARNTGLLHASGDWVTFLDADDTLVTCALEHMLRHAEGNDLVMALCQADPEPSPQENQVPGGRFETYSNFADTFTSLYNPYFFLSVCAKLYRRTILRNGTDSVHGTLMSDCMLNLTLLPSCRGIYFLPETLYHYRHSRPGELSLSNHFHSEWLFVFRQVYETALSLFPDRPEIISFMAQRYTVRVGQHLVALAALRIPRFQKLAIVGAEQSIPFYQTDEIRRAVSGLQYMPIWKAFLTGSAEEALRAAEQFIIEAKNHLL